MSSSPQGTLFQRKLSAFSNTDYFYHKHITAYRRSESFIFEELSMKDLKANFFICFNVLVAGVNGGPTFYLLTNYSKFAGKIAYSQDLALVIFVSSFSFFLSFITFFFLPVLQQEEAQADHSAVQGRQRVLSTCVGPAHRHLFRGA